VAAAWLATDLMEFRGDDALARGWITQARRSLEGLREGPEHGWVALQEAYLEHAFDHHEHRALELGLDAQRIGREHGVPDLEAIGLAQAGLALVAAGDAQAGLRSLDAAAAITLTGDLQEPVSTAWALCMMLAACARLGDVPRAEQWCRALKAFAERYDGRHLLGTCRTSYGCVHTTGGNWGLAETELTAAVGDLTATRAGLASSSKAWLGALRLRQGREAEARECLASRDTRWVVHPLFLWDDAADDERMMTLGRSFRKLLAPWATGEVYLNFVGEEGEQRRAAGFGRHRARLAEVKAQWDPENVFRSNHNIAPRV
jgi:hypothetical protein